MYAICLKYSTGSFGTTIGKRWLIASIAASGDRGWKPKVNWNGEKLVLRQTEKLQLALMAGIASTHSPSTEVSIKRIRSLTTRITRSTTPWADGTEGASM
jgi:hypothetical protein